MKTTRYLRRALHLLQRAQEYSAGLQVDGWHFAVEIADLRGIGVTNSDLRWLLSTNSVLHAIEVTGPRDPQRRFHPAGKLVFEDRSCFVLTPEGQRLARDTILARRTDREVATSAATLPDHGPAERPSAPSWDKDRRVLWMSRCVVKQFKVPAPNQETVLTVFEEEHWPPRIDDPLPSHPAIDPKRRLHDTINSLNRNQRCRLIRFVGDGSGQAISWEALQCTAERAVARHAFLPEYATNGHLDRPGTIGANRLAAPCQDSGNTKLPLQCRLSTESPTVHYRG